MQIDINAPGLKDAVLSRIMKEYAEIALANFAHDIVADGLALEVQTLQAHNKALLERIDKQNDLVAELRKQIPAPRRVGNSHGG